MPAVSTLPSPLGWIGGKSRLAKTISSIIDQQKYSTYVEPFAGGASVFFHKEKSKKEILNDINTNLMTFYKQLQTQPKACNNSGTFKEWSLSKQKVESGRFDMCDFVRLNKSSYMSNLTRFGDGCSEKQKQSKTCRVFNFNKNVYSYQDRLKNVKLYNADYTKMVQKYDSPETLFYADPPYDVATSKEYNVNLAAVQPEKIAEVFSKIKGKAVISFNDSQRVRSAFEKYNFNINPVQVSYSNNPFAKDVSHHIKNELIITNF